MNSFIGLVIFVMLFLVNCPAGYGQQNSLATQRKTQSSDSITREPEPFCPPKEIRDERFCPEKQSRVNEHRDCTALMQAAEGDGLDITTVGAREGEDEFRVAHPGFDRFALRFGRDGSGGEAKGQQQGQHFGEHEELLPNARTAFA